MSDRERNRRFRREAARVLRGRTRLQRDTAAEVVRLLGVALERSKAVLAGAPSDYQRWNLPQLQASVRAALAELGDQAAAAADAGAESAWRAGVDLVDRPLAAGGVRIAAALPSVDTGQLLAMRSFLTERIKDVTLTAANRINAELGLVAIGSQTPADAVGAITRTLRARSRSRAITIVRTELGRAFSVAAQARREQAAEHLPGLKKQWRRSGKLHARAGHDQADGQVVANDEPFVIHAERGGTVRLMFPRDPAGPVGETINCGCEALPWMESWEVKNPGAVPFSDEELRQRELDRVRAA